MKKTLTLVLSIALVLSLTTLLFSAEFAPSITVKPEPEIEEKTSEGGDTYVAKVIEEGEDDTLVPETEFIVIPYSEAETVRTDMTTPLMTKVTNVILEAYADLTSDADLGKIGLALDEAAKEIDPDYNASVFVVSDLIGISFKDTETDVNIQQVKDGADVSFTAHFNLAHDEITPVFMFLPMDLSDYGTSVEGDFALAVSDKWQKITEVQRNPDDSVDVTVHGLGAIAVLKVNPEHLVPGTSDSDNTLLYIAAVVAVVSALGAVAVIRLKKSH